MSLPDKIIIITISLLIIFVNLACSSKNIVSDRSITFYASPEDALMKIREADNLKGILKTIARIEIRSGEDSYPIKAAIIAKKPGNLRIETIPLIGPPDFFMVMNKGTLKVFYPNRDLFYIGKATQKHLITFLPLAISPHTMISFLMGSYPENIPLNDEVSWYGRPVNTLYRLDLIENGITRQSYWVDPNGHYLIRVDSFDSDGELSYSVDYRDFKKVGKVDYPQELSFKACADSRCQSGRIRYSDIELTPDIDDTVFDIMAPPGIKSIQLE
jgi:outer membrane lipoprotein-sorting protein